MDAGYKILEVSSNGQTAVAMLPLSHVSGYELSQTLREDYVRLAASAPESVELDLRTVEFIDGSFFSRVVELRKALQQRSASLKIRVSANLKEIIELTKLNRVLDVLGSSDCQSGESV
jgi:anti-anti-sigma regulatory factor